MSTVEPPLSEVRTLRPVFLLAATIVAAFAILVTVFPIDAGVMLLDAQTWASRNVGWYYLLAMTVYLVFVVGVALSGYGNVKLGADHDEPEFSYLSWAGMLFAAGISITLFFFCVSEPLTHYLLPPQGGTGSGEASARQAMQLLFLHWGLHGWGVFALAAMALAYFAYRHNLPLRIRSALYPLIGNRIHGPIGHAVDTFAALGTIFGLATSLGLGVMQINAGLNYLFGLEVSTVVQMGLIVLITLLATGSVVAGLDSGVRRLSELNMVLAVMLLAFVLVCGPTAHLMQTLVQNTGMYVSQLFSMTFNLYAYEPTGWLGGWTLFYWGWWIAWSPFVGMFIARISRGRSVREFVVGVLLVPLGFTFLWMTIYGNTALYMVRVEGLEELVQTVSTDSSTALFAFFEHLPMTLLTSSLAVLLVALFFVTSADSGALVIDMLTSKGEEESPLWQRIFWSMLVGGLAIALLMTGGLESLQAATIASALPFTVVMILMCWGLLKAMHLDATKRSILRQARILPGTSEDWRARLRLLAHNPLKVEVTGFIADKVIPALEEVAAELRKQELPVQVTLGEDGRALLRVGHGEEMDFFYAVRPQPYDPPSFALQDPRRPVKEGTRHYRAEVYLREGGQDYDVMGWPRVQLIHDVLDQYERHRQFLDHVR